MKSKLIILILLIFFLPINLLPNYKSIILKVKNTSESSILQFSIVPELVSLNISIKQVFFEEIKRIGKKDITLTNEQKATVNELSKYYILYLKEENYDSMFLWLKKHSELFSFEPNYIYSIESDSLSQPNDSLFNQQWALKNIDASKAWLKASGKSIIIGVVDTGLDYYHEDLQGQIWINSKEDINNSRKLEPWSSKEMRNGLSGDFDGIDNDGNGFIDDVIGYDFVDQTIANIGDYLEPDPDPMDEMGHGTLVSGVISAIRNNNKGISGLAPNAKIMVLRTFDITGNAESDDIAKAIVYAASNGAKVLNFSFGETISSTIVHDAIKFAKSMGCFMAASSGNDGYEKPHYPSDYEEVASIGASNITNLRYLNSNYGSRLSIVAPGEDILSTDLGNSYRTANGTSLACPHVSAAAALLIEINPNLKPEEILAILQQSAKDYSGKGWTNDLAAGILNIGNAVNFVASGNISISFPDNNDFIEKEKYKQIAIIGSIITPLFDSFETMIGEGWLPNTWTHISNKNYSQILNDTISIINISTLKDTNYTVRIVIHLKNSKSLEKRLYLRIVSNETKVKITSLNKYSVIQNDKRAVLVAIETNQDCNMSIKFRPLNSTAKFTYKSNLEYETKYHAIIIGEESPAGVDMEAVAIATRKDGSTDSVAFIFQRSSEYMNYSNFIKKEYSIPMSYLVNNAKDLYNNSHSCIAVNNLPFGNWTGTKVYEFVDSVFILKDSINDPWVPVSLGESNGDGIFEIFTRLGGKSRLYQALSKGNSPFGNILFKDELVNNLWAAGMFDITGDGLDELFAYSDTAFHCFSFKNGKYEQLAYAIIKPLTKLLGTSPGFAIGDFDNDGSIELCHSNEQGNIFIFQYNNGNFYLEFLDTTNFSRSPQYICKGDFDSDGIPEIAIMSYDSRSLFSGNESGELFWFIRIIKSNSPNSYGYLWNDYISGVRSGKAYGNVFFRNGLASGNVDGLLGDELVVSTFPNLYIFKWDQDQQKIVNKWWYPSVFSNSAIIYDFDKNGINDIGFSTPNGTQFFEYQNPISKPHTPLGLDGYSLNEQSAILFWQKKSDAIYYEVYKLINSSQGERIAITNKDTIILQGLKPLSLNQFFIVAINPTLQDTSSEPTYLLQVYTHSQIEPIKVEAINNRSLLLHFSGRLSYNTIENKYFEILLFNSENNKTYPSSTILLSDSIFILSFSEDIPEGGHIIHIHSFKDYYNSPIKEAQLFFKIQSTPSQQELYLKSLQVLNNTQIILKYSDIVDKDLAEDIQNYSLLPRGKIINILLNPLNEDEVQIFLSPEQPLGALGKNYVITVHNVTAKDGKKITKGAGSSLSFVFFQNDLENVFVYPNPIKLSTKPQIIFANLTINAEIIIYSQDGNELKRLIESDNNGGVEWDGKDAQGNELKTGIYFFKVIQKLPNGNYDESSIKKFAIIM